MKLSTLLGYTLSATFLLSCSQMRTPDKKRTARQLHPASETVELKDEDFINKKGAENHELADADADDQLIKQEVGEAEIDTELPDSEKDGIPYSRDFLVNKKTKRMQFWVEYFTKKQRERFQRFINNGEEYRHHIEKIFAEHGLPKELYFVGLIESGYYLGARSHASAVGPWQFIKGTGTRYGLKITQELDERQDLFKATRAAAMYFKDMHNVFSSWELALAGYNAGEYGIIRRIMKHGTRDFYELSRNKQLPSETINYVPKVLAAMHVVNNAEKYGFIIPQKKHRLFDRTELRAVQKNASLASISKGLGVSADALKRLNPELRKNATPRHFAGTYYLRVPQGKRHPESEIHLAQSPDVPTMDMTSARPEKRSEITRRTANVEKSSPFHTVKRGETLLSLSRRYKITPRQLAEFNGFASWRTKIKVGQRLAVSSSRHKGISVKAPIVYEVKAGDNLTALARIFDINLSKLKEANNLKRGQITVGQKIILPDTKKGIYTVKRGDHLSKVAREFNQPLAALIKLNALNRKTIYPGQKIIVNMD